MSPEADPPLVQLEGVSVPGLPGDRGLAGLDLELGPGERLDLVGSRRSGLRTLLYLLAGRGSLQEGSLQLPEDATLLVPEQPFLGAAQQVFDLAGGLDLDAETFSRALRGLGLAGARSRSLSSLPAWALRRVSLACAFASPADLLILEEPFPALDVACRAFFLRELARCQEDRKILVLGSYSLPGGPDRGERLLATGGGRLHAPSEQDQEDLPGWVSGLEVEEEDLG